jgi:hypothetical protein
MSAAINSKAILVYWLYAHWLHELRPLSLFWKQRTHLRQQSFKRGLALLRLEVVQLPFRVDDKYVFERDADIEVAYCIRVSVAQACEVWLARGKKSGDLAESAYFEQMRLLYDKLSCA